MRKFFGNTTFVFAALMLSGLSGIGAVRAEGARAVKPTITGGTEGVRFAGSKHPSGNAFDVRTWNLSRRQGDAILRDLRESLGSDYDVIDARGREGGYHYHIEYDPAHDRPAATEERADAGTNFDRPGMGMSLPSALDCNETAAAKVKKRPQGSLREFKGDQDLFAAGDFDGDGETDEAFFVEHEDELLLLVCLGRDPDPIGLTALAGAGNHGIWTAPRRGGHDAACARGYGSGCRPGELVEVWLLSDAIGLYDFERSSRLYYWNADRFDLLWLSD